MKFQNLFIDSNLSKNGYIRISGLLFQWGKTSNATANDQIITTYFPIAFKQLFTVTKNTIGTYNSNLVGGYVNIREVTNTYFKAMFTNAADMKFAYWIAVGI